MYTRGGVFTLELMTILQYVIERRARILVHFGQCDHICNFFTKAVQIWWDHSLLF